MTAGAGDAEIGTTDEKQAAPTRAKGKLRAREPGASSKAAKFTFNDDSDEDAKLDDESDPERGSKKVMMKVAARCFIFV